MTITYDDTLARFEFSDDRASKQQTKLDELEFKVEGLTAQLAEVAGVLRAAQDFVERLGAFSPAVAQEAPAGPECIGTKHECFELDGRSASTASSMSRTT